MAPATLIVNPYASRVTPELVEAVRAALPADVEVRRTERRGHATELARAACAERREAIYVLSGDGGFNEVLNGVDASVPLGLLPGGGTSVLPRALGLPRDPVAAARRLAAGAVRRISVGLANGRRFGFAAGIGLDAELVRRVDALGRRTDGRRPGDAAFVWAAVKLVVAARGRFPDALELGGLGRAAFALVANCDPYTYAGPLPLHVSPRARFELGLDVVAPRDVRARDLPRLLGYLLRTSPREGDERLLVAHDRDRLLVRCDRPLPVHVDGEDLGDLAEVVLECERGAVSVLA
ncbi:MAG TPA: diacylglycerol kinase family protein [Gaiellaceae bacterium]|nr:diacylglycerol kinase family protein [Gaiellaceae bacterium]